MKKYTVITPCYNAENHIRETISSITGQSAFVKGIAMLEYIICDGGSTDRTIQVAETMLDRAPNCSHRIISEPDNGMYDALVKD
jgi:glycosyltransferase involved in cell wall biosynthesis